MRLRCLQKQSLYNCRKCGGLSCVYEDTWLIFFKNNSNRFTTRRELEQLATTALCGLASQWELVKISWKWRLVEDEGRQARLFTLTLSSLRPSTWGVRVWLKSLRSLVSRRNMFFFCHHKSSVEFVRCLYVTWASQLDFPLVMGGLNMELPLPSTQHSEVIPSMFPF